MQSKPRIAILHYAAPPTVGGVESTIAAHARLFADHGYAVQVIAGRGEPFDSRVPLHIIPSLDSRYPLVNLVNRKLADGVADDDFYALAATIQTALQSALEQVDVCIAHNALTLHKNLGLTRALHELVQQRKIHLIAWSHDFAWGDPVYAHELHPGYPWELLHQRWSGVRYVVVSTARQQELFALWGNESIPVAIVPPGIDPIDFLGTSDALKKLIDRLGLSIAEPLLLLPARVTRRKNIELAIEITAQLRNGGHTPKLVVMGPLGPHNPANAVYLDELRTLRQQRHVDDAVIFLQEFGTVDDAMRRDLYLLADALLLPSAREGFGIPILEAGLVRVPIFCTDIPPFHESALDHATYFSPDESPSTIAERMSVALSHDSRYALKQRVLREYAWEHIFTMQIEPLLANWTDHSDSSQ